MNRDFKELLSAFSDANVEFLVIDAHAMAAHGYVRATKDLDVWVRPTSENAPRVLAGLKLFGAPISGLSVSDFDTPGVTFQIGVAPVRIDIITEIHGVQFSDAWTKHERRTIDALSVPVMSVKDLIANKRATGRLQDLADVQQLEQLLANE
jgi:hypothetical protein